MPAQWKLLIVIVAALALVAAGCVKKRAIPTSAMDSPGYHYTNGITGLRNDRINDAMTSFDRVVALDPTSPLGYIGRGLAFGRKGEFRSAFENMSKAKDLDRGIEGHLGMIDLYGMQREKEWVPNAEREYQAARKNDPESARPDFFMGMVYKLALEFDRAADLFKAVLDRDRELIDEANAELALMRKIRRAMPGTEIAKRIVLKEKIDRADCAALFEQEMNIDQLFIERGVTTAEAERTSPTETAAGLQNDSAGHRLKTSIDTVSNLHLRGLEEGPDHAFEPDKLITRAEFALMLEDILIKVSGDEKLATRFLGATSPFADVGNEQAFFNAAMNASSMGFIEADKTTGKFRPGSPVSGVDALLSIRELENRLKF